MPIRLHQQIKRKEAGRLDSNQQPHYKNHIRNSVCIYHWTTSRIFWHILKDLNLDYQFWRLECFQLHQGYMRWVIPALPTTATTNIRGLLLSTILKSMLFVLCSSSSSTWGVEFKNNLCIFLKNHSTWLRKSDLNRRLLDYESKFLTTGWFRDISRY